MQEKFFGGRINGAKESGTHRVQIFKIIEQSGLPFAAEILFEVRAGLGEFDLDFSARKEETAGDGKYYPLPESFGGGGSAHCPRKYDSMRLNFHGGFVFPEAQRNDGQSC